MTDYIDDLRSDFDLDDADVDDMAAGVISQDALASLQQPLSYSDMLPPDLADAIAYLMEPYDADPVVSVLIFISMLSGLHGIGTGINHRTRVMPGNLYCCPVAETGTSKSSQLEVLAEEPLQWIETSVALRNEEEREQWEAQPKSARPKDPPTPLLVATNDVTPEALVKHFVRQFKDSKALLVLKDEVSELFAAINADMRSGRGSALGLFLECWDGKARTKLRVGDGVTSYPASKLSILGCIQPQLLSELTQGTDYSGKWSRFLFPHMPSNILHLSDCDLSEEEGIRDSNARNLLKQTALDAYQLEPKIYCLRTDARAMVNAWFRDHQLKAADPERPQVLRAMHNKAMGQVLRVALQLHLLKTKGTETFVSTDTMSVAMRIVNRCFADAERLHQGEVGLPRLMQEIQRVALKQGGFLTLQRLRAHGSEIIRKLPSADFKELVPVMVEQGWGEQGTIKQSLTYKATRQLGS